MSILIVGQGAIGLLWYHHLIKNEQNHVSMLCSDRLTSIPTSTYITTIENTTEQAPLIIADPTTIANADFILFCVKSYQVETAIKAILNKINCHTILIFSHNGMLEQQLFSQLQQPCFSLLTTHASKKIKPFHIKHTGIGHHDLGLIHGELSITKQQEITKTLSTALPSVNLTKNIKEKQWRKLATNCIINPLTALHNIDNGKLLDEQYQQDIDSLLQEIIEVAAKENITFNFKQLKTQVLQVAKNTAHNCSSMRSDVLHNQQTEINSINGYIVKRAALHQLDVPQNKQLVKQIKNI